MYAYIFRRILYAIPILICVNVFTFILFFFVNTPDDVAHSILGSRHVTPSKVYQWKREHDYHLPRLLNVDDTILVITRQEQLPEDLVLALDDFDLDLCCVSVAQLEDEQQRLQEELADGGVMPDLLDGLSSIIRKLRKKITGNQIILIDAGDLSDAEGRICATLLETGLPFIAIERDGYVLPRSLQSSVIARHEIHDPADGERLARDCKGLQASGMEFFTKTLFYKKSVGLFFFDFGKSDRENVDISYQVVSRMGPSLMITVPTFILGLLLNVFIAMIMAYTRGTYVDRMVSVICILIMSVLSLFYYFITQFVFSVWLNLFPISGYMYGFGSLKFILLPIMVSLLIGLGGGVRFYRTIFLEETNRDYVRTARAKGNSEFTVLFKHILKNAMIPILTNAVTVIPMLFIGSLILESFFGIPGLGGFTLEGIQAQDFRIVGSMVYLGSFLYIVGLIMTDISYTLVDPRIRFE